MNEITLFGFNNLTKSLSFSLYKLHYLTNQQERYNLFIKERYSADNLNTVLTKICHAIGGNVLNIAKQDYQPQGASVTLMISEESQAEPLSKSTSESLVAHLDKSHLCIHTYPEESPQNGIAIFRADIELSTCGIISPLKVLNYVIESFDADVIDIDYRIRGMTRDKHGEKLFVDDKLDNISDYLSAELKNTFKVESHNLIAHNLFHTKLCKNEIAVNDYLFEYNRADLSTTQQNEIKIQIERELQQLFTNSA
ncbi:adenosylmethionine decarboxylase [Candidatus Colwellia aromaticivorans]|uniref:adenosylmethionine decarboxylase n=1 Tax=Candidatus Colwellia aromaticivorans TaxID=2267621 RepID=UPI000DF2BD13|nr:adenosylmethionine decarboxylase [Candidatus Colwellia aromaticivorans]